jgi:hypothetical protein
MKSFRERILVMLGAPSGAAMTGPGHLDGKHGARMIEVAVTGSATAPGKRKAIRHDWNLL